MAKQAIQWTFFDEEIEEVKRGEKQSREDERDNEALSTLAKDACENGKDSAAVKDTATLNTETEKGKAQ